MNTQHKGWVTVVALTFCLAVFFNHFEGASTRIAPEFPGKDASMDELVQFYNEVQQYLNSANRLSRPTEFSSCGHKPIATSQDENRLLSSLSPNCLHDHESWACHNMKILTGFVSVCDLVSDPAVKHGVEIQTLVWTATHEKDISSMDHEKNSRHKS